MSDKRRDDRAALAACALLAFLAALVAGALVLLWRHGALIPAGLFTIGAIWGLRRLS